MNIYAHAVLLPPELYSGSDKITALNNRGPEADEYMFVAMYMENKRTGKLASKEINEDTKEALYDLGENTVYAAKSYGFADVSSAICSKPAFEKNALYRVVNIQDVSSYRFSKIIDIVEAIEKNQHKFIEDSVDKKKSILVYEHLRIALKYNDLSPSDYIYIPMFSVPPDGNSWEKIILSTQGKIASATCFLCDAEVSLIHPKEVIHFSNRKVLDEKSFFTLRALLESPETETMALKLIDGCNISKSLIYVSLLINHLSVKLLQAKKCVLPNVSLWFPITSLTLDDIVDTINSEKGGEEKLSNNQMEFIADNYYLSSLQKSNNFEFKLKPKKK
jgi:hypothetical protein